MEWILEYLLAVKVTCSHAHETIPWYLSGLYFKISDEHSRNFFGSTPAPLYPRNEESDLFAWILFMGKTISIDWFTTVWSLLISSLPVRFQTILKWFRKRLFFSCFFGTRLWQSVTINMLIVDRLSNQKQIEITRSTAITAWGSNRMSHNLCIK